MKKFGLVVIGAHFGVWLNDDISKFNKDNMCNLLPYENKKNHYWKYEKIPGLQIRFSR